MSHNLKHYNIACRRCKNIHSHISSIVSGVLYVDPSKPLKQFKKLIFVGRGQRFMKSTIEMRWDMECSYALIRCKQCNKATHEILGDGFVTTMFPDSNILVNANDTIDHMTTVSDWIEV